MCSYIPYFLSKFGEIQFINQGFITEKPRVGHFFSTFRGPLAQKLEIGSQNSCLQNKWYGRPLPTCQVWSNSVNARRRENENKSVFVFIFCLFVTPGVAYCTWVSQTCRDVRHFNEVQLHDLLIDFHVV